MAPTQRARFTLHLRTILTQAWPVLISSWASLAFGVMDTAMAGHSSAADLQAMALSISIYITVFIGLMGVIHALIPILAQHYGARRYTHVGAAWGQGVWLALGLAGVGALALAMPGLWLSMSGDIDPAVQGQITWYLRALILALPAALVFRSIYCLGTAVSRPKIVMAINLASIGVKLLLNWIFIFGHMGVPALGAVGAGVATAIVSWMMLGAGLWAIFRDPRFRPLELRMTRPVWRDQRELLRLGLPMGGSYLIEVIAFTFMALLVAREGIYVTGGQQIMNNLAALCYMMPMAIGVATASLTAQSIGAGNIRRAQRIGTAGLVLAMAGALLTAVVLYTGRSWIVRIYTDDEHVIVVAIALLQLLPVFHLGDALHCVVSYLLRAYKIAVVPLILQTVALTGVGLFGGWWLGFGPAAGRLRPVIDALMPAAPTGAATMWLMAFLGLCLSAALLLAWYRHVVRVHVRQTS